MGADTAWIRRTAAALILPMAPLRDSGASRGATVPFCLHHGGGRGELDICSFWGAGTAQGVSTKNPEIKLRKPTRATVRGCKRQSRAPRRSVVILQERRSSGSDVTERGEICGRHCGAFRSTGRQGVSAPKRRKALDRLLRRTQL